MTRLLRTFLWMLVSIDLAACAAGPIPGTPATKENTLMSDLIAPIRIEKSFLDGKGLVEVEVLGANGLGHHVTGTVRLALPRGA